MQMEQLRMAHLQAYQQLVGMQQQQTEIMTEQQALSKEMWVLDQQLTCLQTEQQQTLEQTHLNDRQLLERVCKTTNGFQPNIAIAGPTS
jgi:hypothetical protein